MNNNINNININNNKEEIFEIEEVYNDIFPILSESPYKNILTTDICKSDQNDNFNSSLINQSDDTFNINKLSIFDNRNNEEALVDNFVINGKFDINIFNKLAEEKIYNQKNVNENIILSSINDNNSLHPYRNDVLYQNVNFDINIFNKLAEEKIYNQKNDNENDNENDNDNDNDSIQPSSNNVLEKNGKFDINIFNKLAEEKIFNQKNNKKSLLTTSILEKNS